MTDAGRTDDDPFVSVVVATYQRAPLLARLVAALEQQELDRPYEVVIVDDGSSDSTWDELIRLAAASSLALVPLRQPGNAGPAGARNVGWRAARGVVIAFTDDDCVPRPEWLAALVRGLADADVVQGRTVPDEDAALDAGPFAHTVAIRGEGGFYETANVAYRREVLERAGGFDERYRHPYGEDVDLARRAIADGARTAFAPDAVVVHDVVPSSFVASVRRTARLDGVALAVHDHPELRRYLHRGRYLRRSHPLALTALVGLTGAVRTRRWAPAALALPYAWHRLRVDPLRGRGPRRHAAIPLALALDLVEVAVLARSSLRHRVLVL